MSKSFSADFATEAARGAFPVGVVTSAAAGVDWQTWVYMLTVAFLLMQMLWLGWKFFDKALGKKVEDDG